jgi:hypothetical protein
MYTEFMVVYWQRSEEEGTQTEATRKRRNYTKSQISEVG